MDINHYDVRWQKCNASLGLCEGRCLGDHVCAITSVDGSFDSLANYRVVVDYEEFK
jgi:hypothetical protein